jgi:protein O-mannosyl-transferase
MEKTPNSFSNTFNFSWVAGASLLTVLLFTAYFPVLQNGFIWDDDRYLTHNPYLIDFEGLKYLWLEVRSRPQYYPLVFTSFWIEFQLWGLNPQGYHIDNVLLHAINSFLLWRILLFLGVPTAWLISVIFALHPVHVESVAWITERKNVLSGFFYLLSLYTFLRLYISSPIDLSNITSQRPQIIYGLSLFFFVCALLSKTVTCTLPAVILLIFWWKQNRISSKIIQLMTPFFLIGFCFATLTSWMERVNVGAMGSEWNFSFWDRFLIAGRALWFYIGKLIWPSPIIFTYPRWNIDDSVWWQYLYPATFLFLIYVLWCFRKSIGRGPLTAILFFSGSLFPALGFFNIYPMRFSFVADHFQYLASIGIIILIVEGLYRIKGKGAIVSSILLIIFLGYSTWQQIPVYKNVSTLWRDTVQKNPNAWMAHYNLANIFITEQQTDKAMIHYRETIRIKPDFALAPYNLGNALLSQEKTKEAISQYEATIRIQPDYVDAYNNLGVALLTEGNTQEAIKEFQKALELKPDYSDARNNLQLALTIKNEAIAQ